MTSDEIGLVVKVRSRSKGQTRLSGFRAQTHTYTVAGDQSGDVHSVSVALSLAGQVACEINARLGAINISIHVFFVHFLLDYKIPGFT